MKKMIIMLAVFMAVGHAQADAQVNVNVNIGNQPVWGPAGYDYVNYYYLPDYDMYYNVPARQWVYQDRGRWITTGMLPGRYRHVDLYRSYKVVINDRDPYRRSAYYRKHYAGFRGRHDQVVIRDSRDRKYYVIKDHPHHNEWDGDRMDKRNDNRKYDRYDHKDKHRHDHRNGHR